MSRMKDVAIGTLGAAAGAGLTLLAQNLTSVKSMRPDLANLLRVTSHRIDAVPPTDVVCVPKFVGRSGGWEYWTYLASFTRPEGPIVDDVEFFVGISIDNPTTIIYECAKNGAAAMTLQIGSQTFEFENLLANRTWDELMGIISLGYVLIKHTLS